MEWRRKDTSVVYPQMPFVRCSAAFLPPYSTVVVVTLAWPSLPPNYIMYHTSLKPLIGSDYDDTDDTDDDDDAIILYP